MFVWESGFKTLTTFLKKRFIKLFPTCILFWPRRRVHMIAPTSPSDFGSVSALLSYWLQLRFTKRLKTATREISQNVKSKSEEKKLLWQWFPDCKRWSWGRLERACGWRQTRTSHPRRGWGRCRSPFRLCHRSSRLGSQLPILKR